MINKEEIQNQIDSFEHEFNVSIGDKIKFGYVPEYAENKLGGYCIQASKMILINRNLFYSDLALEYVVFHELGHCLFGLSHNRHFVKLPTGVSIPSSILTVSGIGSEMASGCYFENREFYINELKKSIVTKNDFTSVQTPILVDKIVYLFLIYNINKYFEMDFDQLDNCVFEPLLEKDTL